MGLAVAVVGSLGAISIVQASADEVPAPPPAAVTASAEPEKQAPEKRAPEKLTPPRLLPWGDEPEELDVAKPGTSSVKLGKTGMDAAPQDAGDPTELTPEVAPKGNSIGGGSLTGDTSTVPPAPPGSRAPLPGNSSQVYFHYAVGEQRAESLGTYANMLIGKPRVSQGDAHSLAEIAIHGENGNIVEFGWHVDPSIYNDNDVHMFVFFWSGGVAKCYNGCGFVQESTTVAPGATLPAGQSKKFGIEYGNGGWWVAYDSEWIGVFPDRLFQGTFTDSSLVQWFGEVASAGLLTCTEMGNGKAPLDENATRFGSIYLIDGPSLNMTHYTKVERNNLSLGVGNLFSLLPIGSAGRTFRFGGVRLGC